jgi:hypothetical protein
MQSEWFLDFLCEVSKEGVVGDLVRELLRALTSGSTAVARSYFRLYSCYLLLLKASAVRELLRGGAHLLDAFY